MTDRLFLDANIFFSIAYMPESSLNQLWTIEHAILLSSEYAVAEARRNLENEEQLEYLHSNIEEVEMVPTPSEEQITLPVDIPKKDRPVLSAALYANATHLITGDKQDFGQWFGETIRQTKVIPPGAYLNRYSNS
ncbi:MAG: hypothetical protein ABEJ65_07970 [bacterium]